MARIVPVQSIPASDYIGCKIKPLTCDFRGPTGIDPRPSVVPSVCEVCVCCSLCQMLLDQARLPLLPMTQRFSKKLYQRAMQNNFRRTYLNLVTWSDSASLNFNYNKCKAQRITRKLNPSALSIIWQALSLRQSLPRRILVFTSRITSRGISKSMNNALRPAGSWDMYGETPDSSKALWLDAWHTLPQ